METQKHSVLCVDDEKHILSSIKRLLRRENYELLIALSGEEGLEILKTRDIHLVIADHRMPGMSGITFLTKVKITYPDTIRILLTGYTDIESIKESVNQGNIYKFLLKPWNDDNLKLEIKKSLEQHDLIQSNRSLTATVRKKNQELEQINQNLEKIIAKRTRELELQNQALELTRNIFEGLPVPVVGVSSDQTIILINRLAKELMLKDQPLKVGKSMKDFFSTDFLQKVSPVFESRTDHMRVHQKIKNHPYFISLSSLTGRFANQGFILCFQKQEV
ncbi:response regulator [Desulfospira joergensenii]|uniref:response regulator n=1 Tax=Desulfospira joergensenii TaxID=53329 RepID=UPI0003B525B3|nr:response regulator [Desulfospira joergensenii]